MKLCAVYARVSLEEQAEKFGLSSQLSELRAYALKAGYEIAHEFIDDGYSGADLGRPFLTKLRDAVRTKSVAVVIVHDPDRLARKLAHQLILTEEFEKAAVRLEFVTAQNADTMEGRLLLNVRGVIAEYEREKIRERTMRGRREKARQGFTVGGKRPYGYTVEKGALQINQEESAVILQMFKWLVEDGLSLRKILELLNSRGYKPHTSSRWAKSTVNRILNNELYTGIAYYNRRECIEPQGAQLSMRRNKKTLHRWKAESEWIARPVPVIVSPELFRAAKAKLKQNSQHCCGRPSTTVYLLRGILRCSACGRKFYGCPIFGDKYYRCVGRERLAQPRCDAKCIAAKTIETFVWDYITQLLMNPELLESKLINREEDDTALRAEVTRLEKLIQETGRKEGRLLNALLEGDVGIPGMREKAKELEADRLRFKSSLQEAVARIEQMKNRVNTKNTVREYCLALGKRLPGLDMTARQSLLRALLDEVVIDGDQVTLRGILPAFLPAENRPQREHIVIPSRRHLQRALGHRLAAHIREIGEIGRRLLQLRNFSNGRAKSLGLVEELNHFR